MSELIAIPLASDRRAFEVLSALRRLEAEYACREDGTPAAVPGTDQPARRVAGASYRRRRVRLLLAVAVFAVLAASATASGAELLSRVSAPGARPDGAIALLALAAAGVLLVAVASLALLRRGERHHRPAAGAGPAATWLVTYLIRDPAAAEAQRLRATVLQITLPPEAEGRMKAILARVAATAAR